MKLPLHLAILLLSILLLLLLLCDEDPRVAEISGLRGIIAQNDIDRAKAAEECGVVKGDYEQVKKERDAALARGEELEVFVLAYLKLSRIKTDQVVVCHETASDANYGSPRGPWLMTNSNEVGCENPFTFRFVYDSSGNPHLMPSED